MPSLDLYEVYVLYVAGTKYKSLKLCVGARFVTLSHHQVPKGTPCLAWLDESPRGGHVMWVDIVEDNGETFLLRDVGFDRKGMKDDEFNWTLEPLTERVWKELNELKLLNLSGGLSPDMPVKSFKSFHVHDLLEDWWINKKFE